MCPNTYNLSIWFYKNDYKKFSHIMCLNTNEMSICVNKWNEYKVYTFRFAENCSKYQLLHHLKWVWFESIYSWGRKLAVIDFLVITGLPLLWIRLAASCYCYVKKFKFLSIRYAAFMNLVSRFYSSKFLPINGLLLCNIRLVACYSDDYCELFFKIIVLSQNFPWLYYGKKHYKFYK